MERQTGNEDKLESSVKYFKERNVYKKLFLKMREKYISLGHFGGTVVLYGLSMEERQQLGGFFQKNFSGQKSVSISAQAMEKALENSRFAGLKWEEILERYFQEELVGKKEQKQRKEKQREDFFRKILEEAPESAGRIWLQEVLKNQSDGYQLLQKHYQEQPGQLGENLKLIIQAIPRLPFLMSNLKETVYELLPVFAAETTGNPHFFDTGSLGEQLLAAFLRTAFSDSTVATGFPSEEKAALFYRAGLLKDELSNHILVYGIRGWTKEEKEHLGIVGFLKQREPLQLNLMTLGGLNKIQPGQGKHIYIVENPAVFYKLIKARPEAAVICSNGQIRLAVLVLLDLFHKDTVFFYAGDFDPEGLLIAQRLKERYGEQLQLWKYDAKYYIAYQSQVELSEQRLKKLDRIWLPQMQGIKEEMLKTKKAAYQESMLAEYLTPKA